jgi:mevalonate kinase
LISHARAPGKIVLLGEQFVAHGNPVLAAALDRGVETEVSSSSEDLLVSADLEQECPVRSPSGELRPIAEALRKLMDERSLHGVKVTLRSSMPVSAGLSTLAASSVAALAAVANYFGVTVSHDTLYNLGMVSEKLVHGNPSGVDVYVAVHGGMVYFKGRNGKVLTLRQRYPVLIACTGQVRSTGDLISRVSAFRERSPSLYKTLAKASERLVEDCRKALEKGDSSVIPESMNFHQQVLKSMGVSSPELGSLVREARLCGFAGGKETEGGCIIGWPGTGRVEDSFERYRLRHPNSFISYLPSEGVVSWQTPS